MSILHEQYKKYEKEYERANLWLGTLQVVNIILLLGVVLTVKWMVYLHTSIFFAWALSVVGVIFFLAKQGCLLVKMGVAIEIMKVVLEELEKEDEVEKSKKQHDAVDKESFL